MMAFGLTIVTSYHHDELVGKKSKSPFLLDMMSLALNFIGYSIDYINQSEIVLEMRPVHSKNGVIITLDMNISSWILL